MKRSFLFCSLWFLCAPAFTFALEREEVSEKGGAAAKALMHTLGGELKTALQEGGPEAAISVCSDKALRMTQAVQEKLEPGMKVRRTSLKVRNPENAPDHIDRAVLFDWVRQTRKGVEPTPMIKHVSGGARFYTPVVTQKMCLTCHGGKGNIPQNIQAELEKNYPEDRAFGYEEGEVRGGIVVFVPQN